MTGAASDKGRCSSRERSRKVKRQKGSSGKASQGVKSELTTRSNTERCAGGKGTTGHSSGRARRILTSDSGRSVLSVCSSQVKANKQERDFHVTQGAASASVRQMQIEGWYTPPWREHRAGQPCLQVAADHAVLTCTLSSRFTTSMPLHTLPKMVCLPSIPAATSQGTCQRAGGDVAAGWRRRAMAVCHRLPPATAAKRESLAGMCSHLQIGDIPEHMHCARNRNGMGCRVQGGTHMVLVLL